MDYELSIVWSFGTLKLFIGVSALWKSQWVWHCMVPVLQHGHVKSCPDEDVQSSVVEVMGRNVESNYITCPRDHEEVLAINLPILVLLIKNMRKYFAFEIQLLDDKNIIRQLRADNRQVWISPDVSLVMFVDKGLVHFLFMSRVMLTGIMIEDMVTYFGAAKILKCITIHTLFIVTPIGHHVGLDWQLC
jgi:hypothetical protein